MISDFKENLELVQRHKEPQQLHWNKPIFAYLLFVALRIKYGKLVIEYLDCHSLQQQQQQQSQEKTQNKDSDQENVNVSDQPENCDCGYGS